MPSAPLPRLVAVALAILVRLSAAEFVEVETDACVLVGVRGAAAGARFLGVPYATPPVNAGRFAPPLPLRNFTLGPKPRLEAFEMAPACLQVGEAADDSEEDCLYLNLYTAARLKSAAVDSEGQALELLEAAASNKEVDVGNEGLLDVLVWLHGGFFVGGGVPADADVRHAFAVDSHVVLVDVAYRLGVFGFLSSGDSLVGGNFGLRDQQEALRWLRDNLAAFGGDAASVTVVGLDAGAASVGLHLLNDESVELFARVVVIGGGPLAPWALPTADSAADSRDTFGRIAEAVGCPAEATPASLACLRGVNGSELNAAQLRLPPPDLLGPRFPVVVDGVFLTSDPAESFAAGRFADRPAIVGIVEHEGRLLARRAMLEAGVQQPDLLVGEAQSQALDFAFRHFPRVGQPLGRTARQLLRIAIAAEAGGLEAERNLRLLERGLGDWNFVCGVNELVDLMANATGATFAYQLAGGEHGADASNFFNAADGEAASMRRALLTFAAGKNLTQHCGWVPSSHKRTEFFSFGNNASGAQIGGFSRQSCRLWQRMLPWVLQLQDGGASSSSPAPTTTGIDSEEEFWRRCALTFNTMSIIMAAGGGAGILTLLFGLICLTCCGRKRRWPSEDTELQYIDDYQDGQREAAEDEDPRAMRRPGNRRVSEL